MVVVQLLHGECVTVVLRVVEDSETVCKLLRSPHPGVEQRLDRSALKFSR